MEDLLTLRFPAYADRIRAARDAGYDDAAIEERLDARVERALAEGYSMREIGERLGRTEETTARYGDALLSNAFEAYSGAYGVPVERLSKRFEVKGRIEPVVEEIFPGAGVVQRQDIVPALRRNDPSPERLPEWAERFNAAGEDALSRMVGGMTVGFLNTASSLGKGVAWLTDWRAAKDAAGRIEDAAASLRGEVSENGFADAVFEGLGSTTLFLLPGAFIARSLGAGGALLSGSAVHALARYAGTTVSAALEALSEGGSVYFQVLERTGDERLASSSASSTFWLNMPLNFLTDKLGFFGDNEAVGKLLGHLGVSEGVTQALRGALAGAISEGGQETLQGIISQRFGEGTPWDEMNLTEIAWREGLPASFVGALFGVGMDVMLHRKEMPDSGKAEQARKEAAEIFEAARESAIGAGVSEEEAGGFAALLAARATVVAREEGVSAKEWYERQGLEIRREGAEDPAFDVEQFVYRQQTALEKIDTREGSQNDAKALDNRYFAAVEAGDMEAAQAIVDEAARVAGYGSDEDYRMQHRAPNREDYRLAGIRESSPVPDDYWSHPEWYMSGSEEQEAFRAVLAALRQDEAKGDGLTALTVYRAVPKGVKEGSFRNGDWVTPSRAYAELEGAWIRGGFRIIETRVPLKDLWWDGNSIAELGYDDGESYVYKDTRNNRKLSGPVVRDMEGNVVPPSRRFKPRKAETFYQRNADAKLQQDAAAWSNTVDQVLSGGISPRDEVPVMTTPLAFHLIGAKVLPVVIRAGKIVKILQDHPGIGPDLIKQIPEALADPIAIFESDASGKYRGLVAMLELLDKDGATIVAALHLDVKLHIGGYFVNKLSSAYGKGTSGGADNQWFIRQIEKGNLRYINIDKSSLWLDRAGIGFTGGSRLESFLSLSVKTEADLVKLRQQHPGFYHGTDSGPPRGAIEFERGRTVIRLFEGADRSTLLHETGHLFLRDLEQAGKLSEQARRDWTTVLEWLESDGALTREQHERFARGFEAYLMTGRAPSSGLRDVFEKFRQWLTALYRSVSALNVEVSPEVRGVFDRMLATPEERFEREAFDQAARGEPPEAEETAEEDTSARFEDLPPAPEEAEAERRGREVERAADLAAEGDEESLFDPAWFEGTREGVDAVDEWLVRQHEADEAGNAYADFRKLVSEIVAEGGLRFEDLAELVGRETAREIKRRMPMIFRKTGTSLDKVAQVLGMGDEALALRLKNAPVRPQPLPPVLEVTGETLPWIVERMGTSGAKTYLKSRERAVREERKTLQTAFEEARDRGDPAATEELRARLWGLYRESGLIREALEGFAGATEDAGATDGKTREVAWRDLVWKTRESAARWIRANVRDVIDEVTGRTKVGQLVTESDALAAVMKAAQKYSRTAFFAGRAGGIVAGVLRERIRMAELRRLRRLHEAERKEVRTLVKEIEMSTRGGVSWPRKMEILETLRGYDLKQRREETLRIRREMEVFLAENPEAVETVHEEDLASLDRVSLSDMSIDELRQLHERIMEIRAEGVEEYRAKEAADRERIDTMREELLAALGGRTEKEPGWRLVSPGTIPDGKNPDSRLNKIRAETLNPSRLFDWLDGAVDFRGAWHRLFVENVDAAEDGRLRAEEARADWMRERMELYGITEKKLAEVRIGDAGMFDPERRVVEPLTLDQCLHIYAGWLNPLNRAALRYGNGVSEELAARVASVLSVDEKAFAVSVIEEFERNRKRLEEALLDADNLGFIPQQAYIRMYRTAWTNRRGETLDEGLEGARREALRVNGLQRQYVERGWSRERKNVPEDFQQPITLGLLYTWRRAVGEQEHFIAFRKLTKELHAVFAERDEPGMPSLRTSVEAKFGRDAAEAVQEYVNRIADPEFYKGFKTIDQMARRLRSNLAVAALAYNFATAIKQPQALIYYLRDAGAAHLVASVGEFLAHPVKTMRRVWEMDPQVKRAALDRTLEELKRTWKPTAAQRAALAGFVPLAVLDGITRVIGWNAVYRAELARGASSEEARYRAQRVTLNTQQAASPKELARFMARNETLNLLTVFGNQANKIWGVAVHDIVGDFRHGRLRKGLYGSMGLVVGVILMDLLSNGEPPEDGREVVRRLGGQLVSNIPIIGSSLFASMSIGRPGGTPIDSVANAVARVMTEFMSGDYVDSGLALLEAYTLVLGGNIPVVAIKRMILAAQSGDPTALLGWVKRERRRRKALVAP